MSADITKTTTDLANLGPSLDDAKDFARRAVPENTRRAYAADWADFSEWCRVKKVTNLPADPRTLAAYLADASVRCRPSTLRRRLAAIRKLHEVRGLPTPTEHEAVRATLKGIEASFGVAARGKAPLVLAAIEKMVSTCDPATLDGLRARALILLGYAGAFRRSELVALDVADLKWTAEGVVVTVRRSKTDQKGEGRQKAVPFVGGMTCAATALKAWLTASETGSGPVFRPFSRHGTPLDHRMSAQTVAVIVKGAAGRAGIDANEVSGHSLRAGHVTEARARGVADADIMAVTGHKRTETLDLYDRRGNPFKKTSAGSVLTPARKEQ